MFVVLLSTAVPMYDSDHFMTPPHFPPQLPSKHQTWIIKIYNIRGSKYGQYKHSHAASQQQHNSMEIKGVTKFSCHVKFADLCTTSSTSETPAALFILAKASSYMFSLSSSSASSSSSPFSSTEPLRIGSLVAICITVSILYGRRKYFCRYILNLKIQLK